MSVERYGEADQDRAAHTASGMTRQVAAAGLRACRRAFVDFVLPPQCAACRERTGPGIGLCSACWTSVEFIEPPFCDRSGRPFVYDPGAGILSAHALARNSDISRVRAAVRYGDVARSLVHGLKYTDRLELCQTMTRMMHRAGSVLLQDAEVVVPVPLHRWRLLRRRYNQSAILAREICRRAEDVPFDACSLRRVRPTRAQVGLNSAERRRNVRNAFTVAGGRAIELRGRRVLLVDDVVTTGATAEACARALLAAGAGEVDLLAFAMVCDPVAPGV
jgi:ComF family protein